MNVREFASHGHYKNPFVLYKQIGIFTCFFLELDRILIIVSCILIVDVWCINTRFVCYRRNSNEPTSKFRCCLLFVRIYLLYVRIDFDKETKKTAMNIFWFVARSLVICDLNEANIYINQFTNSLKMLNILRN